MTRWSPDTCGCCIDYNGGVFVATVRACPRHLGVANSAGHLTALLAENTKKNHAIAQIVSANALAGTKFSIDAATGAMTITASAIATATLTQLRANFPGVTFVVDPTIPVST